MTTELLKVGSARLPALSPGDTWLDMNAMVQLSGVPISALRKLSIEGKVPTFDAGSASTHSFRFQLSRTHEIVDVYRAWRAEERERRSAGQFARSSRHGGLTASQRIDRVEAFLAEAFNGDWEAHVTKFGSITEPTPLEGIEE